MKVTELSTNKEIDLNKNNFVASGGEGDIYRIQNKAYKIYQDSSKMLPEGKINELQKLKLQNIIKPLSLLKSNNKYIGYTMMFVDDCISLCSIFPPAFKSRNNIKTKNINDIINIMKEIVQEFHKNKMFIVDMNELNFLVKDKYFDNAFLIDVDSCQTPSYKATAIMESIKDFHAKNFSELTDWFSFGILTFQMYTGLHPFRGKHSQIKDFTERMKQNISVYDKNVSVPAFIKDFENLIPKNYNEWFKILFTSDKRQSPPDTFADKVVTQKVKIKITDFIIELFYECKSNIASYNNEIFLTEKGLELNHKLYIDIASYSKIIKDENNLYSVIASRKQLKIKNITDNTEINCNTQADYVIEPAKNYKVNSNLLYIINDYSLYTLNVISKFNITSINKLVDLVHSYQVFNNVIVQQVLDSAFVILLRGINKVCENVKINEIAKQRILNAELNNNILIVIAENKGKLKRYIIKFNNKNQYYESYKILSANEVKDIDINFIILDTGISILSDLEKGLILFRTNYDDMNINIIKDNQIVGRKLCSYQNNAMFIDENKIYKFRMK